VRLATTHALVKTLECRDNRVLVATTNPNSDLRHQVDQLRRRVSDVAVIVGVGVERPIAASSIRCLEQGHLDIVD